MSQKYNLVTQAVSSVNILNTTIRQYGDMIEDAVVAKNKTIDTSTNKFNTDTYNMISNIHSKVSVSPNQFIDTAYFNLFARGELENQYDLMNKVEFDNFVKYFITESIGFDSKLSSIKVKVISGSEISKIVSDPKSGININGKLASIVKDYQFSKNILILDLTLIKDKDINTLTDCVFAIKNPPDRLKVLSNNGFTISSLFNLSNVNVPISMDSKSSASIKIGSSIDESCNIFTHDNSSTNIYSLNDTYSMVTRPFDLLYDDLIWESMASLNANNADETLLHVKLVGDQWKHSPLKLTLAITLPYMGVGGTNLTPKWCSEAAAYEPRL